MKLFDWLKGKKTYIVGIIGILSTLGMWWNGTITTPDALAAIWASLSVMGLRHAITTQQ